MVFTCYLCRQESRIYWTTGYYCSKCKRLQDSISIWGDRVHEVVENVLFRRDGQKQEIKIADEIVKEIQTKEYNLRNKNKLKNELKKDIGLKK